MSKAVDPTVTTRKATTITTETAATAKTRTAAVKTTWAGLAYGGGGYAFTWVLVFEKWGGRKKTEKKRENTKKGKRTSAKKFELLPQSQGFLPCLLGLRSPPLPPPLNPFKERKKKDISLNGKKNYQIDK